MQWLSPEMGVGSYSTMGVYSVKIGIFFIKLIMTQFLPIVPSPQVDLEYEPSSTKYKFKVISKTTIIIITGQIKTKTWETGRLQD